MKYLCYCAVCCSLMGNLLAMDGNGLLESCQKYLKMLSNQAANTNQDLISSGLCIGYVGGVQDTARGWHREAKIQLYCIPEAAKSDQLIRVTLKFLENNPAQLHYSAATLVETAFVLAFPCKEGN